MKYNNNKKRSGFTLVEFLLYIAFAVIMTVVLSTMGASFMEGRGSAQALEEVRYSNYLVFEKIKKSIHEADSINAPESRESENVLSLEMQNEAVNPTVFSLEDGVVMMREGAGEPTALTSERVGVEELLFRNTSGAESSGAILVEMSVGAYGLETQHFVMSGTIRR